MARPVVSTREQFEQALPLVRAIVEDQRHAYMRLRRSLGGLRSLSDLDKMSGEGSLPDATRDDLAQVRNCLLELDELGVRVEDVELGIVTMRGLHRGDVVNLCWKLGEDRVRFWFPADATYAARRPLDAASR